MNDEKQTCKCRHAHGVYSCRRRSWCEHYKRTRDPEAQEVLAFFLREINCKAEAASNKEHES